MGIVLTISNMGSGSLKRLCKMTMGVFMLMASVVTTGLAQLDSDIVIKGSIYLQTDAQLWVRGDISIQTDSAYLYNAGDLNIEGHLAKDSLSRFAADSTGLVVFDNEFNANSILVDSIHYIVGDFTGVNAFEMLKVENEAEIPALYLATNDIEVRTNLELGKGHLVTAPPSGHGFTATNHQLIISGNEPGIITGNLNKYYVAGKLHRAVRQNRSYLFPIGPQNLALKEQPFELTIYVGPEAYIDAEFINEPYTPLGTTAYCDVASDPDNILIPDGIVDELMMDCVLGKWKIETEASGFFYDINLMPENDLEDQCDFQFHWLAKDGVPLSDCPINDYSAEGLTSFSTFDIPGVIDTITGINLPIELVDFTATGQEGFIDLAWITLSEVNSDGFEIQKSTDGENFERLGWVEGNGNSNNPLSYSYQDFNVQNNTVYYYRLKLLDLDGHFEYSEIKTAILDEVQDFTEARVYPNPINPKNQKLTYMALNTGDVSLNLYNSFGQLVFEHKANATIGFNTVRLPDLATGPYHLVVQDGSYTRRGTIIIAN